MPDAALFGDVCRLLSLTLDELLAGERTAALPGGAGETVNPSALDRRRRERPTGLCKCGTILLALGAASINLAVGGTRFEGTPVLANLLAAVLLVLTWSLLLRRTREELLTQKIAAVILAGFLSLSAASLCPRVLGCPGGAGALDRLSVPSGLLWFHHPAGMDPY